MKFEACYMTCQWGEFRVKNATLSVHILFLAFFLLLFIKMFVFLSFPFSFFYKVSKLRNRILTNQKPELMIRNCQWNFSLQTNLFNDCRGFALLQKTLTLNGTFDDVLMVFPP